MIKNLLTTLTTKEIIYDAQSLPVDISEIKWVIFGDYEKLRTRLQEAEKRAADYRAELIALTNYYKPHDDCKESKFICDYIVGDAKECPCAIAGKYQAIGAKDE